VHCQIDENLSKIVVYRLIPARNFNGDIIKKELILSMAMWAVLIRVFEEHNMYRIGFETSEHI